MSALRQASEALCLQDMTLLEFGAGVLSGDGLRDSTHPRVLLEQSHVRKICSD